MKKLLIGISLFVWQQAGACSWGTAERIYYNWWESPSYSEVKVCALPHSQAIVYSDDDLLFGLNATGGRAISFGGNPQQSMAIGSADVSITGNTNITNLTLNAPPYYLSNSGNSKIDGSNKTIGIFRFYTQTITYSCARDNLGFDQIRRYMYSRFLQRITANNQPTNYVASTGTVARINDIPLTQNDSTIYADAFFIEGKTHQDGSNSIIAKKTCTIDVYIKLQIKPNNSPNFKHSGEYNLTFRVN